MKITDVLPPVITRGLKAAKARVRGPVRHLDVMGRRIEHRGSRADLGVVEQVFYSRDYDLSRLKRYGEIQRFYDASSSPLIIDAGANIGASAVWFAQTYPKASVLAIEPHPGNFELLEKNVAGLNVKSLQGAIAAEAGEIQLFDPGEGEWGFRTGAADGSVLGNVPAFTVGDLVDGEPFILKIDIEGGEADLFDSDVFARFPVVIIELHDWMLPRAGTSSSFLRWHVSQDRDFVHISENVFSLCNRLLRPEVGSGS